MTTLMVLVAAALSAASGGATSPGKVAPSGATSPGKLAPDVSKEMQEAIVAINKALGLESWPMHDVKPCIDRGGQGIQAKEVTPDDTRKCAASSLDKGFPELGKSYVLAVPMAEIGPVTVLAIGIGGSDGWGAYSCDPDRKCLPVKVGGTNKWGKRVAERLARACADQGTLWFPADKRACSGGSVPAPSASAAPTTSPPSTSPAPTTPPPSGSAAPTTRPPSTSAAATPAPATAPPPAKK
jgi:hypothetical protein